MTTGVGVPDPATVADHLAITDVLYAYADGIDGRDWELVNSVFTEDAVLDYAGSGGPSGTREEVVPWIEAMLSQLGPSQHLLGNIRVAVDGDVAGAVSQLLNPLVVGRGDGDVDAILLGGRYVDRLRRTPTGWRITSRCQSIDWQTAFRASLPNGVPPARPHPAAAGA